MDRRRQPTDTHEHEDAPNVDLETFNALVVEVKSVLGSEARYKKRFDPMQIQYGEDSGFPPRQERYPESRRGGQHARGAATGLTDSVTMQP